MTVIDTNPVYKTVAAWMHLFIVGDRDDLALVKSSIFNEASQPVVILK